MLTLKTSFAKVLTTKKSDHLRDINVVCFRCSQVRTLKGIIQPMDLQMIDDFCCVVLCDRELRTYNLDTGTLLTKVKGMQWLYSTISLSLLV